MRTVRLAILAGVGALAAVADAHPVHEVVQNAYITLAPASVELQLELTTGPKVAGKVMQSLDTNGDKRITQVEAQGFANRVLLFSKLVVDRRPVVLRLVSVDTPSYAALMGAHGTIKVVARAQRSEHMGSATLGYRNGYNPAESRCDANVFLRSENGLRYQVTSQIRGKDGRDLLVRFVTSRIS